MKFREITKIIEQDGWRLVHQVGSHKQYKHPIKLGRVTYCRTARKRCGRGHPEEYPEASWLG